MPHDRPPLVLIVEDSPEGRAVYAEALDEAGLRVDLAVDGIEGVRKAVDVRPDVILMDLSMPGMDGLEATRRLKADDRTRLIPVILFTGEPAEDEARAAGCDDFLRKPGSVAALVAAVRRQLRR